MTPARFHRLCRRYGWLARAMVAFIILTLSVSELVPIFAGHTLSRPAVLVQIVRMLPIACYLVAILAIGHAMGRIAADRPVPATLATALRQVGLMLIVGGAISVVVVTNLVRWIERGRGGYLNFDITAMTLAVIGGALVLLGHVVRQAAQAQDELDEFL